MNNNKMFNFVMETHFFFCKMILLLYTTILCLIQLNKILPRYYISVSENNCSNIILLHYMIMGFNEFLLSNLI